MKKVSNLSKYAELNASILPENYPAPAWCKISVVPARTGKSFRVTVFGNMSKKSVMDRLNLRMWIKKTDVSDNPIQAANLATHSARQVKIRYNGSQLVYRWRDAAKAGKASSFMAKRTQQILDEKFGKGWLYTNETAQIEAQKHLTRLLLKRRINHNFHTPNH